MIVKALVSFAGSLTMFPGEIREVNNEVAKDLLDSGYVEEVKSEAKKKKVKNNED
ncbi:MAG: hypothetical protein HUJ88_11540 [Fusobacterium necrophorum]|nr:hypothetical protein [Fusobacterium necrophorum]